MPIIRNVLFLVFMVSSAYSQNYGAYGLFPQGSTRTMGMGGASSILADDASGIVYNPAALAFGDWSSDFTATNNQLENDEFVSVFEGTDQLAQISAESYQYQVYAVGAKLGKNWVIGAGFSSPYAVEYNSTIFETTTSQNVPVVRSLTLTSIDLSLTRRWKNFAIGVAGHIEEMEQNYISDLAVVEDTVSHFYLSYGAAYRKEKFGFGLYYFPERNIKLDNPEALNDQLPTVFGGNDFWFADVLIPARLTTGFFYQATRKTKFVVDIDFFQSPTNTIFVGSRFNDSSSSSGVFLEEAGRTVIHGGAEIELINNKKTEVYFRFGGYNEPPRVSENLGEDRLHLTLGLEVRLGPAVLSVSFDKAEDFQNTAQGFSLKVGEL